MKRLLYGSLALLTAIAAIGPALPAFAGEVDGPRHLTGGRIAPGQVHRYTFTFWGDELAEVAATGDGDIDLRVINGFGEVFGFRRRNIRDVVADQVSPGGPQPKRRTASTAFRPASL